MRAGNSFFKLSHADRFWSFYGYRMATVFFKVPMPSIRIVTTSPLLQGEIIWWNQAGASH